jgi:hypothetical protein
MALGSAGITIIIIKRRIFKGKLLFFQLGEEEKQNLFFFFRNG